MSPGDGHLGGGQEDVLRGLLIRRQRVPLTPVDQVKGHGFLLLDERLLLSMRLEETNAVFSDDDHRIKIRSG